MFLFFSRVFPNFVCCSMVDLTSGMYSDKTETCIYIVEWYMYNYGCVYSKRVVHKKWTFVKLKKKIFTKKKNTHTHTPHTKQTNHKQTSTPAVCIFLKTCTEVRLFLFNIVIYVKEKWQIDHYIKLNRLKLISFQGGDLPDTRPLSYRVICYPCTWLNFGCQSDLPAYFTLSRMRSEFYHSIPTPFWIMYFWRCQKNYQFLSVDFDFEVILGHLVISIWQVQSSTMC